MYVADSDSNRIMRWPIDANKGTLVVGGSSRISRPTGIALDRNGNLYVAEYDSNRVQQFVLVRSTNS